MSHPIRIDPWAEYHAARADLSELHSRWRNVLFADGADAPRLAALNRIGDQIEAQGKAVIRAALRCRNVRR